MRQAPRKHPDLVEVVRQSRLERTQHRHVHRDVFLVPRRTVIMHRRQHIRPHKPLVLRVARQRIRRIHIQHPRIHPARVPRAIAHQPPVLHHRRRRRHRIHLCHRRLARVSHILLRIRARCLRNCLLRFGRRRARRRLLHRRPAQQLQLVPFVQQKEVLRVAPRLQVHVHQVAHHARRNLRVTLMLVLQLVELVHHRIRRNHLLFDPARLASRVLHLDRVPPMLQHLQPLAVIHLPGPVRNRGHAIAQKRLLRRHVHVLVRRFGMKPLASAQPDQHQRQSTKTQRKKERCTTKFPQNTCP